MSRDEQYVIQNIFQTVADLKRRLLSTVLTCLREGLAAIHIADYLNRILVSMGETKGPTGAVMMVDTGDQCSIAGIGQIFDEFLCSGRLMHYAGFGAQLKEYYDVGFDSALYRVFKFDQTYYCQPYDCTSHKKHQISIFALFLTFLELKFVLELCPHNFRYCIRP